MRRLLVIAHQFPPAGGIGVQRVLRFCRDLPNHGWQPLVLTGSGADYPLQDATLARSLQPPTRIERTDLPLVSKRFLPRLAPPNGNRRPTLSKRLGFALWIYDDFYAWILPALIRGKRILREFPPDAILATGSPFCSLIAAYLIGGGRIPLFVDFRDGWHECPYRRDRGRLPSWVEGKLEDRILRRCGAAFFVTRGLTAEYKEKYPALAEKLMWLPNGYELSTMLPTRTLSDPPKGTLRVAYIGKFTPFRRPDAFLKGVRKAVREYGCSDLEVEFVGGLDDEAQGFVQREGLSSSVRALPFLPHREALDRMHGADVLLLVVDRAPGYRVIQTGKIFEYMVSGRPILCISPPDSEAARTVEQENLGIVIPPEDDEAIAHALVRWAKEKRESGGIKTRTGLPSSYDQSRITALLVNYLENGIGEPLRAARAAAQYA